MKFADAAQGGNGGFEDDQFGEDLYDEFGNYIGPDLDSSDDENNSDDGRGVKGSGNGHVPALASGANGASQPDAYPNEEPRAEADNMNEDLEDLDDLSGEEEERAVVLHEDKSYYRDAEDVFDPDTEIMVQYEDTEGIDKPLVAPVKVLLLLFDLMD